MTENAAATTPAAFFSPGASIKKRTASATRLTGASCRIRTNDPEITNHVLWPTELKRQIHNYFIFEPLVGFEPTTQAYHIAPLQPTTFAAIKPWRIRRELAVWDLPVFRSRYLPMQMIPVCGCKGRHIFLMSNTFGKKNAFFSARE